MHLTLLRTIRYNFHTISYYCALILVKEHSITVYVTSALAEQRNQEAEAWADSRRQAEEAQRQQLQTLSRSEMQALFASRLSTWQILG